jgi:osmotically inducible protein OsmC
MSWAKALRRVRGWLTSSVLLQRCWRRWSTSPPPRVTAGADRVTVGRPIRQYLPAVANKLGWAGVEGGVAAVGGWYPCGRDSSTLTFDCYGVGGPATTLWTPPVGDDTHKPFIPAEEVGEMSANPLRKVLYTAEAVTEGGRAGHGRTTDGRLDLQLSVPEDMGGQGGPGTNPEQLFAVGFGACFQSALLAVAQGRKLDAGDSKITARVGLGPTGHGGFGLQVGLDLHAPHLSSAEAAELMARADLRCPYSNATRGNIQVTLSVDGAPIQRAAA